MQKIKTLVYSRVSGYYNAVEGFNKGKKEEFSQRKYIDINKALEADTGKKSMVARATN